LWCAPRPKESPHREEQGWWGGIGMPSQISNPNQRRTFGKTHRSISAAKNGLHRLRLNPCLRTHKVGIVGCAWPKLHRIRFQELRSKLLTLLKDTQCNTRPFRIGITAEHRPSPTANALRRLIRQSSPRRGPNNRLRRSWQPSVFANKQEVKSVVDSPPSPSSGPHLRGNKG
jgi:hypothetical protein